MVPTKTDFLLNYWCEKSLKNKCRTRVLPEKVFEIILRADLTSLIHLNKKIDIYQKTKTTAVFLYYTIEIGNQFTVNMTSISGRDSS